MAIKARIKAPPFDFASFYHSAGANATPGANIAKIYIKKPNVQ